MVIYEREDDWVMVPQHYHGLLSGEIAKNWNPAYCESSENWSDVIFAIAQHDRAWIELDETPFWNDRAKAPYSFIDFPMVLRFSFYKKGIDEIEKQSPYAGLLCSMHYHSFFKVAKEHVAIEFCKHEMNRQEHLLKKLNLFDAYKKELLQFHFLMIQFCDNLSLYLCLQDPGTPKKEEFPWFREGFPEIFPFASGQKIVAEWLNSKEVSLSLSPLLSSTTVSVDVKEVKKADIRQFGIARAFKDTEWTKRAFCII